MYRLLSASKFSRQNLKTLTTPKWTKVCGCTKYQETFSTFSLLTFHVANYAPNAHSQLNNKWTCEKRFQTTTTNAGLISETKHKRKRFRYKKFTELLQINNGSYTQTKASVKNLKSKRLSDFIDNVQLVSINSNRDTIVHKSMPIKEYKKYSLMKLQSDEFCNSESCGEESPILFIGKDSIQMNAKSAEQLQNIMESYKVFRDLNLDAEASDYVTEEAVDFIHEPHRNEIYEEDVEETIEETVDDTIDPIQSILTEAPTKSTKKQKKVKEKSEKVLELEKLSKHHSLVSNLTTYLQLCVSAGMINRGFATLLTYRYKCKRSKTMLKLVDIKLYNILLSGYADKANFGKIKEILAILKEDKIAYTPQTYAAIFECLGRAPGSSGITKHIRKYANEANANGISFNDIMDKSKFTADKREIVLDSIFKIEPDFQPIYTVPVLTYNNKLVNSLNKDVKPADEVFNETIDVPGSQILNAKRGFTKEQLAEMAKKQLEAEFNANITIKSIQKFPPIDDTVLLYRKKLNELHNLWRSQIRFAFCRDLNTLKSQTHSKGNRAINLLPYLRALTVEQYADILLQEIHSLAEGSETFSYTVGQLYKHLGTKVQARFLMDHKKHNGVLDKTEEVYQLYIEAISNGNNSDNSRQCWQRVVHQTRSSGASMNIKDRIWPPAVTVGIGRFLYQILMRDVKIDVNIIRPSSKKENAIPAFYTLFRNEGRLVKEEVKPHPILSKLHRGSQQETLTFPSNTVPMICPPQPWSTPYNGGYLLARSELIRLPYQTYQQWDRVNSTNSADMYPALDSLNQLASIPWKVYTEVLDVVLKVFNDGGSKELDVPRPPHALPPLKFAKSEFDPTLTKAEKYQMFRQKMAHRRKQSELYSLWCEALYRLSLANHYRDKVFWLPHNMDFRGRVYPIPPHLNHLGSDLARSLLVFHQQQPLGKDGFGWLKLHCINLTGLKKKSSVNERLAYAEKIMDDIIDSADKPLSGRRWWTKSDEPWQTLAVCKEIAKVSRCPNPEKYMSSIPIHQDGSCNGLQHYAALGRDTAGAISVNLAPSDIPQDVYSGVAALVEKGRVADAENGVEIAQILDGYVQRKVIKQTVMTTVYGVTKYGARLQIAKQLKDIDSFPKEHVWRASSYLTAKTFESLREMFTSTKEIQDWFTHCARLISAIGGHNVEWITPLGLPVVQPYNRFNKFVSQKLSQRIQTDLYAKPNVLKQKNAFPPNFIHSLDSTHMMLTSLHCERAGITFVSVHDCFWTHACNVPIMNRICREQFVALHSQPILEDLSEYLVKQYSYSDSDFENDGSVLDSTKRKLNKILQQIPAKGDFDLNNVLKSIYFFS